LSPKGRCVYAYNCAVVAAATGQVDVLRLPFDWDWDFDPDGCARAAVRATLTTDVRSQILSLVLEHHRASPPAALAAAAHRGGLQCAQLLLRVAGAEISAYSVDAAVSGSVPMLSLWIERSAILTPKEFRASKDIAAVRGMRMHRRRSVH
jgi:hypothetical protein